jgi:hypothetical protein
MVDLSPEDWKDAIELGRLYRELGYHYSWEFSPKMREAFPAWTEQQNTELHEYLFGPKDFRTGSALYHGQPVTVISYCGKVDGHHYVRIEGTATGIPFEDIQYSLNSKPAQDESSADNSSGEPESSSRSEVESATDAEFSVGATEEGKATNRPRRRASSYFRRGSIIVGLAALLCIYLFIVCAPPGQAMAAIQPSPSLVSRPVTTATPSPSAVTLPEVSSTPVAPKPSVGEGVVSAPQTLRELPVSIPSKFPLHWHVGAVDPRFYLSADQVKAAVERATQVWEVAAGRQLFVYDANGGFPVQLVFDQREENLRAEHEAKLELERAKSELERAQESEVEAMNRFKRSKEEFDSEGELYDSRLQAHNRSVDYWNALDGAPPEAAETLRSEAGNLSAESERLNMKHEDLVALQREANSLVDACNNLSEQYNSSVNSYNMRFGSITQIIGECVTSGDQVREISIYAFNDSNHLAIVLAHEFGHAIGMKHVEGDGAIMSAIEQGEKGANDLHLTPGDEAALRNAIGH